ncbi:MAG TPA: 2-hydroxyacyl-CoA dehydratase [Candidatus Cloacimonas sp.]|jgi:benzoyl-CoA reductase/2-hydroxyglutaryl-CoA dehydratase subunit BcrC/BadD/HgdB|nr:2-hydroxyacyl-CoA dehydratase [Candidatus Cloacimonas sp.]HRR50732.1 2-hydroxyacyl-CoA dehydratase [Candidatus Cloacimonas sp.]HRV10746.1 2-hydroxyacyl-CoA dehydratase [Candidatus Cloacimonas sp.]
MIPKRIGFTTSFPVEVLFAAGHIPVDLNNVFISQDSSNYVQNAELKGFPRTLCSWIKGNYIAALSSNLDMIIGIVVGDCSNSNSLLDMFTEVNIPIYRFSFPANRNPEDLDKEITKLENYFGVSRSDTLKAKKRLDEIRKKLLVLDEWTWKERLVSGLENHLWQVNSSDFGGNPDRYESELDMFLKEAEKRDPLPTKLRLAYLGVPPIYKNIYDTIIDLGGDVVFNEVQRQFAMPYLLPDIVQQYIAYTYPYSVFDRLKDIKPELEKRNIEAVISYTQSFCHLQLDNLLLRKYIDLPFLTLEGDQPEDIDARTLLRLESFFEVHS